MSRPVPVAVPPPPSPPPPPPPPPPTASGRTGTRAVLAFAVPGAALALALNLGFLGGTAGAAPPQREAGVRVAGPAFTDVEELRVGDCFTTEDDLTKDGESAGSVRIVSCDKAHEGEVYAVFNLPDGPYPGKEKVARMAEEKCSGKALAGYAGDTAKLAGRTVFSYDPSDATWARGDREVICFVGVTTGTTTGSVRASG
ncbi:septum formation family protein [Streptomyces sp. NPDC090445]|uniref:septum formation family protein n=1 Tax=Streptomyces sp. NPDC090445 TaxID=3365963 RepID=UPI00381EBA02